MPDESKLLAEVRVLPGRMRSDARGRLHVVLGASQVPQLRFGELYVVAAEQPGDRRGDHLHRRTTEVFAVLEGAATLELRDPDTGEGRRIELDDLRPQAVLVPAGLAHCLVNRGPGRLLAVAWATEEHDPDDVVAARADDVD